MDAIRLHKAGFTETVASLGTALTTDQVKLLSRYTDKCFICYDGDSAGRTAAIGGSNLLSELDTYVVNLPQGLDPDEFLLDRTPDDFEKLLSEARPFVLHEIEMATSMKKLFEDLLQLLPEKVLKFKSKLCEVSGMQASRIEATAKKILESREKFPESSLADLYDPLTMPEELMKAHKANDAAVCKAYGFDKNISEEEIVSALMKLYEKIPKSD